MKLLKRILIGIAILLALLLLVAFLLPKELKVDVSEEIDAPSHVVYNIINDYTTQPDWNPWAQEDESMKITLGDRTEGKGATYTWKGDNSGSGSQEILASSPEEVKMKVVFDGMGEGLADYKLTPDGDKTNVTWSFLSQTGVPWNLFNLFTKGTLKSQFARGLKNIGELAKSRYVGSTYNGYTVKEEIINPKSYITNRAEVPVGNAYQYYTQNLTPLFQKIQETGLELDGKPGILFYNFDSGNTKVDMAAALPLKEDVAIADNQASITTIDKGKALVVDYYGDYSNTIAAHNAIQQYMRDRKMLKKYPLFQEFVTDTSKETDPSKWHTRIVYPVAQ